MRQEGARPVVGVICEYDPFHRGHARHFALIRERLPGALIVCVMSGCFTQRGQAALFAPGDRAGAAAAAGAGVVLELPCAFAVRDAENFALGGAGLLARMGGVGYLSFGAEGFGTGAEGFGTGAAGAGGACGCAEACESAKGFGGSVPAPGGAAPCSGPSSARFADATLAALEACARLMEAPDAAFSQAVARELAAGAPLAAAKGRALAERLPALAEGLRKPNNVLGLCYLRALMKLGGGIRPLIVPREGDYRAAELGGGCPSATAVRAAYLRGDAQAARDACGWALPASPVCRPDALDQALLYAIRSALPDELRALPDCTEGLHDRLAACARRAASREALLDALATRRYPRARMSRLMCHALLGVTARLLSDAPAPAYARLLALNAADADARAFLAQSRLPVIAKPARGDRADPLFRLDERAYDLWALGAGLPAGLMYRQRVRALQPPQDLSR